MRQHLIKRMTWLVAAVALGVPSARAAEPISPWAALTRADIEAIHTSVMTIHPAVRDPQSPGFIAETENEYRAALAHAAEAKSFLDWRATVNGFVQSFRDGHTFVRYNAQPGRARWPGFLIDGQGGGYVASSLATSVKEIQAGDRLIRCDGTPIDTLLKSRLDRREADWSKLPERIRQAWRLFVDYDVDAPPPLQQCTFQHAGVDYDVKLSWREENPLTLIQSAGPLLRRSTPRRPIALSYRPDGAALVQIGSFGPEDQLDGLAKAMTADRDRLHAAPYVVFDLRGNAGGNSTWGATYGEILFGKAVVAALDEPASGKYFRASPEAVVRLRLIAKEFEDAGPTMAQVATYWKSIADRVAADPDGDKKLFVDFINEPKPKLARPPASLYRKPVYVLTDAGCFSSCVVAANTFIKLGGINVGEVMGQNEEYGEITGPITLPSGLARYWLPISIIRQRREDLGGFPVAFAWVGPMEADAEIYQWIAGLASHSPTMRQ